MNEFAELRTSINLNHAPDDTEGYSLNAMAAAYADFYERLPAGKEGYYERT